MRKGKRARSVAVAAAAAAEDPSDPGPSSLGGPAALIAILVAALCILVSVSFRINDPDIWQHLLVGKAIWQLHTVPTTHLWTWPSYGAPDVLPSWGFRALLWPFWSVGGIWGLYVWRWLTTLTAFGILLAAARTMGARGLSPLLVLVLCGLTYRLRTQIRPETLVVVLLALEIWILESGRAAARAPEAAPRARGPRELWRSLGLVAIAWAWANVHISYHLGLALLGIHLVDAWFTARRARDAGAVAARDPRAAWARRLSWTLLAAVAISFVNPFGWRALWQPFEFFLFRRNEPIYITITELNPIMWGPHWKSGLPLLMLGWPVLLVWRARRSGLDLAEAVSCGLFTVLALLGQRFAGFYALIAAPYVARDLDLWVSTRRWPEWTARTAARVALVSIACVAVGLLEWTRREYPLRVAFQWDRYPVVACDFMAANGIRGHGFNQFYLGGYLLWRFWPDRERLPFMDIHQSGTREDRDLYSYAFSSPTHWEQLNRKFHFDYALIDGHQQSVRGDHLLDFLDADSTWALVFRDDAAALYVRRSGPLEAVARQFRYYAAPGGEARIPLLFRIAQTDTFLRGGLRLELERQIAESPYNARAHSVLATLAWIEGRRDESLEHLLKALEKDPEIAGAHQRIGLMALAENRPEEALRRFKAEQALGGTGESTMLLATTYQMLGDSKRAMTWYRKELAAHPQNAAARESLAVLERRMGR